MITSELYTKITDKYKNSRVIKDKVLGITYAQSILELLYKVEKADKDLYDKFISAPASTAFHGVYAGGLFDHSLNVCFNLLEWMLQHEKAGLTPDDCILVGMLHDMCKAELYSYNGTKYVYDKAKAKHHAKESLDIITKRLGIKLNIKQKVLILLHMSSWHNDEDVRALGFDKLWLMNLKHIKLLQAVNWADMNATKQELEADLKKEIADLKEAA